MFTRTNVYVYELPVPSATKPKLHSPHILASRCQTQSTPQKGPNDHGELTSDLSLSSTLHPIHLIFTIKISYLSYTYNLDSHTPFGI
jgi:hypothetical protein